MSIPNKSSIEDELKFYELSVRILSFLLVLYLVSGYLLSNFYGISLMADQSDLSSGIIGGFIGVGLFIQIRRYILYRKIGKGTSFLASGSFILLIAVILAIIYLYFL